MNNVGPHAYSIDVEIWKSFDRLPRPVSELIANAPYDYVVTPFLQELNTLVEVGGRRWAIEQFLRDVSSRFVEAVGEDAYKLYGASHPQAIAPRNKKKAA